MRAASAMAMARCHHPAMRAMRVAPLSRIARARVLPLAAVRVRLSSSSSQAATGAADNAGAAIDANGAAAEPTTIATVPTARPLRQGGRTKKPKPSSSSGADGSAASASGGASAWAPIRGTHDSLPVWSARQRSVESVLAALSSQFGYGELRSPLLERAELFARSLGTDSDVVQKEMFRFDDHGTDTVLRPEATASVARALLHAGQISSTTALQRYWYTGPMFRRERPQAGRYRQFLQFGVEMVGGGSSEREAVQAEAEVIAMGAQALRRLGLLRYVVLELNSLGDTESRAAYVKALTSFLETHKALLSEDSQARLARGTVLRILDSKEAQDQALLRGLRLPGEGEDAPRRPAAPTIGEHLTPAARSRFEALQDALRSAGVRFELNPFLVRGLDYYAHACFEFCINLPAVQQRLEQLPPHQRGSVPAQSTVLAGGRYDGLFKTLGGPIVPAVGWAAGVDRLLLLTDLVQPQEKQRVQLPMPAPVGVVLDREGAVTASPTAAPSDEGASAPDPSTSQQQSSSPSTSEASGVSLEEAYASLCTFVRDGCVLPSSAAELADTAALQSLHAPLYNVVQSFHPNVWKQLKAVTKPPSPQAAATSAGPAGGEQASPSMAAVLILGPEQLRNNEVQFRDQQTREQCAVKLADLRTRLRRAATGSAKPDAAAGSDETLSFEQLCNAYRAL